MRSVIRYNLVGSRFNQIESVLVLDQRAQALLSFETFEKAKASFQHAYNKLLTPSFNPSIPPSKEELEYHREVMRLIIFMPIILESSKEDCLKNLNEWRNDDPLIFRTKELLYNLNYWHCTMKDGFLKKFNS